MELNVLALLLVGGSVVSDSLRPHGLQHTRLPCPSPSPRACSDSRPSSQWYHPSSVTRFSSCLQSFPTPGFFLIRQLLAACGQSIGASASASVLPMNIQDRFPLGFDWFDLLSVQGTLKSLLKHHSSKASILRYSAFFMVQLSHPYMTTRNTIALTRWTFVSKVMSLLFNMLSRFIIAFLPRSKHLNFMAAVTICSDFGAQENKVCHCFQFLPIYLPWSVGIGCHDHRFWNVEFKPAFPLSSFTLIKRLFSSSSLSALRVVSSAYPRLLIVLPAIFLPACASSSLAFRMMYSAHKFNQQGDSIKPWCTPFPILNQCIVPCLVLKGHCYNDSWWSGKSLYYI